MARFQNAHDAAYDNYVESMVRHYRGYSVEELQAGISTRKQSLADGFLSKRERAEFQARVNQMTMVLEARQNAHS